MAQLLTPPDANANSYCDVAFADEYFDLTVNDGTWFDVAIEDKSRSLIHASIILNSVVDWTAHTIEVLSSDVPLNVKRATCELAISILGNGGFSVSEAQELDGLKVGPIELRFSGDYSSSIPGIVWAYLRGYGEASLPTSSNQIHTARLIRI